ncbi:hypothetical protein [Devosia sp. RR2S18]|uniref:hypothetical protein n=1 Tax=Devosia rhizosphaerae TaxID=3049774 RepID=UPI002540FC4E|nr:hypothetical protein [Devosia sp. RR2S18]WIJ25889.1 hypothetical protein QOV41_03750 [Devosia sp. RR2S18]
MSLIGTRTLHPGAVCAEGTAMGCLSNVKSALVVEDDFLIASDIELMLSEIGVRAATTAASCAEAFQVLERGGVDFATVDIRLADGRCDSLVQVLEEKGIRFVYVTASERSECPWVNAPWVKKPICHEALRAAVFSTFRQDGIPGGEEA